MSRKRPPEAEAAELRKRAEVSLGDRIAKTVPSLAPENIEALVHELRVHQIELELQCEELRRTRQDAEDSRDRYCDLYESAPAPYVTLDPELRIEQINGAGERLLGLGRAEIVGRRLAEFVAERDVLRFTQQCREVLVTSGALSCEVELMSVGEPKTVLIDARLVDSGDELLQVRLAMTDITARKQAEERLREQEGALQESQEELRALSARLLTMEQEVRQRIARDLQVEFSQRMTTLIRDMSLLEQRQGLETAVIAKLHEIKRHLSHLGVDLHHLAHRLHSGFLDHCELHVAMKEYIDDLNMFARPQIAFEAEKVPTGCRPDQAVALFRVLQEALVNVAKHADAKKVEVALATTDQELVLTVCDMGKGFDKDAREAAQPGFGLIIMRERMRAMGGRFTVESRRGGGTTVTAAIPLVQSK